VSTTWRPPQHVRAVAIGVIRRGSDLLVVAVQDDAGATIGWRPLGGTIELGERAAAALQRELVEELGFAVDAPKLLTVLERIYGHYDAIGHEIVFVFEAAFRDPDAYQRERFRFHDGGVDNHARWIDLGRFRSGAARLFPVGLIDVL
jgi:8-oxo-dGTP pyrophosphatase MutT (NUDIX family)